MGEEEKEEKKSFVKRVVSHIKKRKKWWIIGVILLVLVGTGGAVFFGKKDSSLPVQTAVISRQDLTRVVVTSGHLESTQKQEFFTPVDSTLMELIVKEGDRVKKGQFLGRLDSLELCRQYENARADMAEKEANLAQAKATNDKLAKEHTKAQLIQTQNHLHRMEQLYQAGAVTVEDVEKAKVDWAQAKTDDYQAGVKLQVGSTAKQIASLQAQVELAAQQVAQNKERMELATFVADRDGVVLFVGAEKGNRVLEGTHILTVGDDDNLQITANVNEMDAGNLQLGQSVNITCSSLPGKTYHGEVSRVSAAAIGQNQSSGQNGSSGQSGSEKFSVPVTVQLKGTKEGLKVGYTVDLSITVMQKKQSLVVPVEALCLDKGKKSVFVVEKGIVHKRMIETEMGNELYDRITSGIKAGERVILNPQEDMHEGQKVNELAQGEKK